MRTTITLADDVAAKLQMAACKSGRTFEDVVNETLRNGLAVDRRAKALPPFKIAAEALSLERGFNDDKVEDIFDRSSPHLD